jgi:ribosomal protein L11 methylase PrmA
MTQQTVYLSGDTTAIHLKNDAASEKLEAFKAAEEQLKRKNYKVVNPNLSVSDRTKIDWTLRMQNKIKAMMYCDVLVVLPDWDKCKEAQIEVELALNLRMTVLELTTMKPLYINYLILTTSGKATMNVRS